MPTHSVVLLAAYLVSWSWRAVGILGLRAAIGRASGTVRREDGDVAGDIRNSKRFRELAALLRERAGREVYRSETRFRTVSWGLLRDQGRGDYTNIDELRRERPTGPRATSYPPSATMGAGLR